MTMSVIRAAIPFGILNRLYFSFVSQTTRVCPKKRESGNKDIRNNGAKIPYKENQKNPSCYQKNVLSSAF